MRKFIGFVMIFIVMITFVGCEIPQSAEQKQTYATQQILTDMNNQIGMPNVKEFYEKKMAKEIYELRDNSKLVCYAYTQAMNGKLVYIGKCMGYGLPYSTQYTNPEKYEVNGATLPQADPNGLYMPSSSSATWIMLINEENGKREIMYCEPNTIVTQSKMSRRLVESWSLPDNY